MSDFPFQRSYSLFTQHQHLTFTLSVLSLSVGADSRGEDKKLWTEPNVTLVVTNLHFMWTCRLVKAVDVNVVWWLLLDWKENTFPLFRASQGSFDFSCPFFPHMDFLKAARRPVVIAAASPPSVYEGAERSRLRYPTEALCVGAPPGRIFTLLASFHTITARCRPHSHGNVKTSSPHVSGWAQEGNVRRDVWRAAESQSQTVQTAARRRGSKCYLLISQSKKPPEETHTDRYHQSVVQVMKTLSRTQTQPAAAAVHAGLFSAALVGEDAATETSSAGINND